MMSSCTDLQIARQNVSTAQDVVRMMSGMDSTPRSHAPCRSLKTIGDFLVVNIRKNTEPE